MSLSAIEQKLLNVADTIIDAAANLVAAKNPAYDSLITLGTGLVDQINQSVNPSAPAAAASIASAAAAISGSVVPVAQAASQIGQGSATATQKASDLSLIIGDVESVAKSIAKLF